MTTSIAKAMMEAFKPRMAVRLENLGRQEKDSKYIIELCHDALRSKYITNFDREHRTIYIGKKV